MKLVLATVAGAVASAVPAMADLDWGIISTAGDPDPVTAFDLADPGNLQSGLGFVDGNFNRGMDFNSQNSFYYFVSTDTLNDPGDRGLWFWDNNVNSQLTTIDFSDAGDGDATLSNDANSLFVSVSDGDGIDGDSLYVFSDLGGANSFSEIGETGLSQIIGLAMDPVSGLLYGYDSSTESLYTIDTGDGSATLVGASGLSLPAIGGMDFSADGSTLLLTGGGVLYTVDKSNGLLTPAGDTGLNASALSYRVPTPASAALLGLGGLAMCRRRR